jgi:ribosomal protein S18 acetylase RimI-like enzyme
MKIRRYRPFDLETLKTITAICFDGVCIDQNIEQLYGLIHGKDWRWRKKRHIDDDAAINAAGIFVAEEDGQIVGYISTRIDPATKVGGIPNFAVLPAYQQRGIGSRLLGEAVAYLAAEGMRYARIETLAQNDVGAHFYPKFGFQEVARQVHYVMPVAEVD